jgi:hypothetical protein
MVVMDGVVMGPHIVLMIIALEIFKMHMEECFVDFMKYCMVIGVTCRIVTIQRCHPVKHVHFIMSTGTHMLHDMGSNHYLEFADW